MRLEVPVAWSQRTFRSCVKSFYVNDVFYNLATANDKHDVITGCPG